jgi:hypothetical protein
MTTFTKRLMLNGWRDRDAIEHMVEIEIDVEGIARALGEKAFRNKSKRSHDLGGMVKVKVRPTTGG